MRLWGNAAIITGDTRGNERMAIFLQAVKATISSHKPMTWMADNG